MAYVINRTWFKQRSVLITLLDLGNTFGEAHHNLMKSALIYHHIPEPLEIPTVNLYTNSYSYIIANSFSTVAIPFKRGVLQSDCLGPRIFSLCFNTFIQFIKHSKHKQLGFSPRNEADRLFQHIYWFQLADDAAVITTTERENQL